MTAGAIHHFAWMMIGSARTANGGMNHDVGADRAGGGLRHLGGVDRMNRGGRKPELWRKDG
jgi:hypothetical protein